MMQKKSCEAWEIADMHSCKWGALMYMACLHVCDMHCMYMECRVNAVVPTTIDTESVQRFKEARGFTDEGAAQWAGRHIIKR